MRRSWSRGSGLFATITMVACLLAGAPMGAFGQEWEETSPMGDFRSGHRVVALGDHRILSIGGYDAVFGDPPAVIPPKFALSSAEIYDPLLGSWTPAGSMNVRRSYFFAVRLDDGSILIAGGRADFANSPGTTGTSEIYDPIDGISRMAGSLGAVWSTGLATRTPRFFSRTAGS
jgi:hypothetical protein